MTFLKLVNLLSGRNNRNVSFQQDNFGYNLKGLRMQLRDLRILLEFFDPQLWDQLHLKESTDMFFCFRWLLVLFKRELNFEGVQRLWEVIFEPMLCVHVFCSYAFIQQRIHVSKFLMIFIHTSQVNEYWVVYMRLENT